MPDQQQDPDPYHHISKEAALRSIRGASERATPEPEGPSGSLRCDGMVGMLRATALKSCDTCEYQEGRHYCLLHTRHLKNMDTVHCKDWSDKHPNDAGHTPKEPSGSGGCV